MTAGSDSDDYSDNTGHDDGDDDGKIGTTPMGERTECKSESVDVRKTASS